MSTFSGLRSSLFILLSWKPNPPSHPSFPQYSRHFCRSCWRGKYDSAPKELALKAPLSSRDQKILRPRYTSLSRSIQSCSPYSFQSILICGWEWIVEFDTCAVQMFGLVSLLPFSCTCTCAVVQKIACTQTGYSLLWPLLLLHCAVDLQHVLYAWSRADVLEQRRSCNGTNTTTSNLNSHITISIGISISRYHLNNRLSYRQRNSVSVHL